MKACPFRLIGVKGDITTETAGGETTPLSAVQCLGPLCAWHREHNLGSGKSSFDCALVAAGSDSSHLREQLTAIAQIMRTTAPRR